GYERPARDAEQFRGLRLIAAAVLDRSLDAYPLFAFPKNGLDRRIDQRRIVRRRRVLWGGFCAGIGLLLRGSARSLHLFQRQVLEKDTVAGAEHDRALHHIAELADVAGPRVRLEERHDFW